MIKSTILAFSVVLSLVTQAQLINLTQTKTKGDIRVENAQYSIYIQKSDLLFYIPRIDSVLKTDNSGILTHIRENSLSVVDLNSTQPGYKDFISLLKSNLASFLLLQGKAAIYQGDKLIRQISADKSPEMVGLDGSSKITIDFSENGTNSSIFIGNLNTKLSKLLN